MAAITEECPAVIGAEQENGDHAALMAKFPDMEHDAPFIAHVAPERRGQIVWHCNRVGGLESACVIAGHCSAGMVGMHHGGRAIRPRAPRQGQPR
jgi:uncharacterized cupredoxin-like copper-binding protein